MIFIAAFITGCVAAASATGHGAGGLKFAAGWTIAVTFIVAAAGTRTVIKRTVHTPLTMGAFLGAMTVLSSQYLILCAIFAGESIEVDDDKTQTDSEAFSVFSAFIWILFGVFVIIVCSFREQFMTVDDMVEPPPSRATPEVSDALPVSEEPRHV